MKHQNTNSNAPAPPFTGAWKGRLPALGRLPNWLPSLLPAGPWHRSTKVCLGILTAVFLFLNVPGRFVNSNRIDHLGAQYHYTFTYPRSVAHGWPSAFLQRDLVYYKAVGGWEFNVWTLWRDVIDFDPFAGMVNLLVLAWAVAVVGCLCEVRRRRRANFWQYSLGEVLLGMTLVAGCAAYGTYTVRAYRIEQETIRLKQSNPTAIGVSVYEYVRLDEGGPTWLRRWIGEDPFRFWDRAVYAELRGDELIHAARFRRLRQVVVDGLSSNKELAALEQVAELETLEMPFSYDSFGRGQNRESADWIRARRDLIHLPRLPHLRALSLAESPFRGHGLPNIPQIELLDLGETEVSDACVPVLCTLKKLRLLNLDGTRITATGVARLQRELPDCQIEIQDAFDAWHFLRN